MDTTPGGSVDPEGTPPRINPERIQPEGEGLGGLSRGTRGLLWGTLAGAGVVATSYGVYLTMDRFQREAAAKDASRKTEERREERRGEIRAGVKGRADVRAGKSALRSYTVDSLNEEIIEITKDEVVTVEELPRLRKARNNLEITKIYGRLDRLDDVAKLEPAKVDIASPVLKGEVIRVAGEVSNRGGTGPWEKWMGDLNAAAEKNDVKKATEAVDAMRAETLKYQLFFTAEVPVVFARAAKMRNQPTAKAMPFLAEAERRHVSGMVGQLHEQNSHEEAVMDTLRTFHQLQDQYQKAKKQMTDAGFRPKTIDLFERNTLQQKERLDTTQAEQAAIETVLVPLDRVLAGDNDFRKRYEEKRDEYYGARKLRVPPTDEDVFDDLRTRRVASVDELHANLHYPTKQLVDAEVLMKRLGWAAVDRGDMQTVLRDCETFLTENEKAAQGRGDLGVACREIRQLVDRRGAFTIDDVRAAFDRMPKEKMRMAIMLSELYEDWAANQLAGSWYEGRLKDGVDQKKILNSRKQCFEGSHRLIVGLADLQRDYQRDFSGYGAVQGQYSTVGLQDNALVIGTRVTGLDETHRKELLELRIPEMRLALDAIRANIQTNRSAHTGKDAVSRYYVDTVRRLLSAMSKLNPVGSDPNRTKTTMYLTPIFQSYDLATIDRYEEALDLLERSLRDPRMRNLGPVRRNMKNEDIEKRAAELAGVSRATLEDVLNGSDLDRVALARAIQRKLDDAVTGVDEQEGTMYFNLEEYGTEHTAKLQDTWDYKDSMLQFGLLLGGIAGLIIGLRGLRDVFKEKAQAKLNRRVLMGELAPILDEMRVQLNTLGQQLAEVQGDRSVLIRGIESVARAMQAVEAIIAEKIRDLTSRIDAHDLGHKPLPDEEIRGLRAELLAWEEVSSKLYSELGREIASLRDRAAGSGGAAGTDTPTA